MTTKRKQLLDLAAGINYEYTPVNIAAIIDIIHSNASRSFTRGSIPLINFIHDPLKFIGRELTTFIQQVYGIYSTVMITPDGPRLEYDLTIDPNNYIVL